MFPHKLAPKAGWVRSDSIRSISKGTAIALSVVSVIGFVAYSNVNFAQNSIFDPPKRTSMVASLPELARAINTFGSALFTRAAAEADAGSDGCFLSPWGLAHALGMLLEGVEPGSAGHRQLLSVVFGVGPGGNGKSQSGAELNDAIKGLSDSLTQASNGDDLIVTDANSAWAAPTFSLQPAYVASLASHFGATVAPLTGAAAVNGWVSEATRGKIKTIIDEGAARQASLVLINAIYFKGTWEVEFPKRDTFPLPFHLLDGSTQHSPMMYLAYKKGGAVQAAKLTAPVGAGGASRPVECVAVKLAYTGGAYSAVVAMPQGELAGDDGPAAEPSVRLALPGGVDYAEALAACRAAVLSALSPGGGGVPLQWAPPGAPDMQAIKVYLPRFEVEFGASLSRALQGMGLTAPFEGGEVTRVAAGGGDLRVSDVLHKVYAKVDEQGTEAAAATAVVMVRSFVRPPPELLVRFDRPFVFAVVHEGSGLALFCGEVRRPEAGTGP